jgi:hypothetical protein
METPPLTWFGVFGPEKAPFEGPPGKIFTLNAASGPEGPEGSEATGSNAPGSNAPGSKPPGSRPALGSPRDGRVLVFKPAPKSFSCAVCGIAEKRRVRLSSFRLLDGTSASICRNCHDALTGIFKGLRPLPRKSGAKCSVCGADEHSSYPPASIVSLPGSSGLSICEECLRGPATRGFEKESRSFKIFKSRSKAEEYPENADEILGGSFQRGIVVRTFRRPEDFQKFLFSREEKGNSENRNSENAGGSEGQNETVDIKRWFLQHFFNSAKLEEAQKWIQNHLLNHPLGRRIIPQLEWSGLLDGTEYLYLRKSHLFRPLIYTTPSGAKDVDSEGLIIIRGETYFLTDAEERRIKSSADIKSLLRNGKSQRAMFSLFKNSTVSYYLKKEGAAGKSSEGDLKDALGGENKASFPDDILTGDSLSDTDRLRALGRIRDRGDIKDAVPPLCSFCKDPLSPSPWFLTFNVRKGTEGHICGACALKIASSLRASKEPKAPLTPGSSCAKCGKKESTELRLVQGPFPEIVLLCEECLFEMEELIGSLEPPSPDS